MGCGASSQHAHTSHTSAQTPQASTPQAIDASRSAVGGAAAVSEEDVQVRLCLEAGIDDLCTGEGCTIQKTEERGITLVQLKALLRHVSRRCQKEGWTSTNPHNPQGLTVDAINLYDLTYWVVRPATKTRQCSYVELVAAKEQPPSWFVSHWWGEAVSCFVNCIAEHMSLRGLAWCIAYWVCAYANNQHQLGADIAADPQATSFFLAMCRSEGVLVVLDENSTPFTRVWCAFEEACATRSEVTQKEMLLDIATSHSWKDRQSVGHDACILTSGLTPSESLKDQACTGVGHRLKVYRESMFPVKYIEKALGINIELAEASQPADRRRILNSIAKRGLDELDEEPLRDHPEYARVNSELKGLFAVAGWRSAVSNSPDVLKQFSKALQADIERKELDFSFAFSKDFTSERLQEVAAALPPNLEVLRLDCGFSPNAEGGLAAVGANLPSSLRILNVGLRGLALRKQVLHDLVRKLPPSLITLTLELSDTRTSDDGIEVVAEALPQSLKHLSLGMQSLTVGDRGLEALAKHLPKAIESVQLNLMNCVSVTGDGVAVLTKQLPSTLRVLKLLLLRGMIDGRVYYIGDSAMNALAEALPTALETFKLDITNDVLATDAGLLALTRALPGSLRSLQLELRGCSGISTAGMTSFAEYLPRLEELDDLQFNIDGCEGMTDSSLTSLADNLPKNLHSLHLDVTKCTKLTAERFQHLAKKLPRCLVELELVVSGCHCIGDDVLCSLAEHLPSTVTSMLVSAAGCSKVGDAGFVGLVSKLPSSLQVLRLNFSEDVLLTAAAPRALASSCPASLHTLSLNLSGCSGIMTEGLDELMDSLPVRSLSLLLPAQERDEESFGFTSSRRDFVVVSPCRTEAFYDPELCGQAPYITVMVEPPVRSGVHSLTFEMGAKSIRGTFFNVGVLPSPLPKDLGTNTGKAVGEEVGGWAASSSGTVFENNNSNGRFLPSFNSTGQHMVLTLNVPALTGTISHEGSSDKWTFKFKEEDLPLHPAICLGIAASMKLVAHK